MVSRSAGRTNSVEHPPVEGSRGGPGGRGGSRVRHGAALGAGILLALGLAACSGTPAPVKAAATPTPTATYPADDVPTGSQLAAALLTTADLPSDYSEESAGAADSGAKLSAAAASVNVATATCSTILNVIGQSGFGEASYASNAFTPASDLGEFDETLLEFHGTQATSFIDGLRTAFKRCATFTAPDETGDTESVTLSQSAGPKIGSDSTAYTVKVGLGGETMVMNGICVRSGTAVLFLQNSLLQGSSSEINQEALARELLARIPADQATVG
jgi:hypothetical protein